jgi:maltose alpha-D-glucosyltransferase/alpha-amylase
MVSEWSGPRKALDGAFHADFYHWVDGFNDIYQKEGWRVGNGTTNGHSFFDREGKGDITHFLAGYEPTLAATKSEGYICLPLGNHDIARLNNQRSTDDLEMIMAFGLTMPGIPFLYYGNEIGMRQLQGSPQIEGCYAPRAGARSPMQWAPGRDLGFSRADPARLYLPVDHGADAPTVAAEESDPNSLLNRVRALIRLKHTEPALAAWADYGTLVAKPFAYPYVYYRAGGGETLIMVFNPAAAPAQAAFTLPSAGTSLTLVAGKPIESKLFGQLATIAIPGESYAILRLQ